jgi:hypothetical protein
MTAFFQPRGGSVVAAPAADLAPYPSISAPSANNALVAFTLLAGAMGSIRQAQLLAPHLFPGEELDAVLDALDTELLELQRLPDWK